MNLKPRSILLLALDAFGGRVSGKTLLQKRLYFTEILLNENLGLNFDAHYYGPYSANVNDELVTLKVQGQLREDALSYGHSASTGFEIRRCAFEITSRGLASVEWLRTNYPQESQRIAAGARRVTDAGDLDYMDLSFAAKAHWILRRSDKPLTDPEIAREAQRFGWKVEPEQVRRGIGFLFKVGLAAPDPSAQPVA